MALKFKLASKVEYDALAEPVRKEYVEKDNVFVLDVEGGAIPADEHRTLQTKFAEFRDNNKKLFDENKDLKTKVAALDKYEGIDPDKYREMETEIGDLKKKGVGKAEDLPQIVAAAVERATKPFKDQLEAEQKARAEAQRAADQGRFRELISADATTAGVEADRMRHVLREASELFDYKDGQVVAKDGVRHPTDPLQDYTPKAWLQNLAKSDAYLFGPSNGGGAPGANGNGGNKPVGKVLRNPSPEEMGAHMDDIASGKITVIRS